MFKTNYQISTLSGLSQQVTGQKKKCPIWGKWVCQMIDELWCIAKLQTFEKFS